jgi:hypothetical protein
VRDPALEAGPHGPLPFVGARVHTAPMSDTADPAPILDALCRHYAGGGAGATGGAARWLRHAWATLAVVGEVPQEIPAGGAAGAEARICLASLALFCEDFNDPEGEPEPPGILDGPHALPGPDLRAWMAERGLQTVAELRAEALDEDPGDPAADESLQTEDIEFAIDDLAQTVIGTYARLRGSTSELFAELWAQRTDSDPSYPLSGEDAAEILSRGTSAEQGAAFERLEQQLATLRG